ncbi:Bro-N domain-containing protein [Xylella fastidiosa subsp. multiplex]|uniref:BRO-N domain-containing protein n=1 Tax=Xylella fastidiosa TaxID=2371 RepID=UPI000057A534|nr:Bro-N domain-containing protein [Xylella fastidiosa]KAJ4854061.1 Bro-N domain-containing protein [Xylella fastidiosa subsp. multiplex]MDC6410207.1 Bro-N domain-containing protein [Xylella fastidiosa subsp. multiplex]MDC6415896.1 Bro-N domain-containing protein [Xylella fastidiosa subsp. multiplex]MDC6416716.1 Bro-N domain-containing protein [Xylella fastidiosa subsp. multiplex]MDC6418788.1 Bro-N domain-containing protein [Xylella fastidiosa subsp. multiplex]
MTQLPSAVCFSGKSLSIIDRDGTPYLSARELARALGYADERSVLRIYARRTDEFTEQMTTVVNLTTVTGDKPTRLFSPRGCHLVAMFARTSVAAAFRRWVLDVLEGLALPQHSTTGTLVNDDVLYAIWFLCGQFKSLHETVFTNKVPQALAWLGARQMSGALYDRLLDGLHGGVGPIEKALGPQMERVAQRVSGITYHGLR